MLKIEREYSEEIHSKSLGRINNKNRLNEYEKSEDYYYLHSDMITKIYDLIEQSIMENVNNDKECVIDYITSYPEMGNIEFETVNARVFRLTLEQI